jgi:hypothetical protein
VARLRALTSSGEREGYERDCAREFERQLKDAPALVRDGTVVHIIRLTGTYPDTRLILDITSRGGRGLHEWQLWPGGNGDFGAPSASGELPPPSIVARDVMVYLLEL